MISGPFWNSLSREDQAQLRTIIFEVTLQVNERSAEAALNARRKLAALGVTIRIPTEEQRAKWVEAMQPVWDLYFEDIGEKLMSAAQAANR